MNKLGFTTLELMITTVTAAALTMYGLQQVPTILANINQIAKIQCEQQTIVADWIIEQDNLTEDADKQRTRDEWQTACGIDTEAIQQTANQYIKLLQTE